MKQVDRLRRLDRRWGSKIFGLRALAAVAVLGTLSCSPDGPTEPGATAGRITVTASTSGSGAPATYSVRLDGGAARTIDAGGSTTFGGLSAGNYSVELVVPANCSVTGANPRTVGVQEASTTTAAFVVTCSSVPTGAIGLTTQTTGEALDADGYSISVDGGAGRAIGLNGTLLLPDLTVGTHDVQLSGVADNCMVQGDNPRTLTVNQNQTTQSTFTIVCSATTGLIDVTVTTTGAELDPDGYTVDLDGVATQAVAVNGTTTFTGVEQGEHFVTLQDVAPNCSVAADNPLQSTVVAGETTDAAFSVTCAATSGGLTVSASTSGSEQDPNGYTVSVDGGPEQAITVNGSTNFPSLTPGDHDVELLGVAANCAVSGSNPRTVAITAGAGASTTFDVVCSSTVGAIQVNMTTTGAAQDPNGYVLNLDGSSTMPVGTNGSATFTGVAPGSHSVLVQDVAANCTVSGNNPRTPTVTAGATTTVNITVTCVSLTGSIRVTMNTSGSQQDPNGYTVTLDGGSGQSIGINGSRTFSGVIVGDHDIEITGVATNCAVQGANPRTVTVTNNTQTQVDIDVVCSATAGSIEVSVTTTGDSIDANGYTVNLDSGAQLDALTANGSKTFNGVAPGSHSLMLENVATNCSVTSSNPATTTVTAGNTSSVSFTVVCTRTTGDIRVTASSSGMPADANGYTVTVDGGMTMTLPINGNVLFADLTPGSHAIEIADVAATCTVSGSITRNVSVTANAEAGTTYTVTCAPLTGSIQVTATTTGVELDPDGYSISLDGTTSQAVSTNGSTTFNNVVTGSHSLTLTGDAGNCTVTSTNPTSTTVSQGATSTVNFTISCAATTGSIDVDVTTTGVDQDPDGYTVQLDAGTPEAIGINGSTSFTSVSPGSHNVTLAGLAANCTVSGTNPRNVTVTAGAAAAANFTVNCTTTSGSIDVDVTTTGVDQDPDGYTVQLDAGTPEAIGINGSTSFTSVSPGSHNVTLAGLAANCTVSGTNPRNVTVTAGAAAAANFTVNCTTTSGSIDVDVTTTGVDQDPDGYTVQLDAGAPEAIGINGSTSFTSVSPGSHDVTLAGLAANCTVSGTNPRNVTVTAGAAAAANFTVDCTMTSGSIDVSTSTSGVDLDTDGYTVQLDADTPETIGINATTSFTSVTPGTRSVALAGLATNCAPTGTNPRSVSVTAGNASAADFVVTCSATTGTLRVTANTSGIVPDPDGYTVALDGGATQALAVNGDTLTYTGQPPGAHTLVLDDVAVTCTVTGTGTHTPTVTAGATTIETYEVNCI